MNPDYKILTSLRPLMPMMHCDRHERTNDIYLYVWFKKDINYPYFESIETHAAGEDPAPHKDIKDPSTTRSVYIKVSDVKSANSKLITGEYFYLMIKIEKDDIAKDEIYGFIDVDHEDATHGGNGSIHYPPGAGD